jgi:hypothetical protein
MQADNFDYDTFCLSEHIVQRKICRVIQLSFLRIILLNFQKFSDSVQYCTQWFCPCYSAMDCEEFDNVPCKSVVQIVPENIQSADSIYI